MLTEWEVTTVLAEMKGLHALMTKLLYGTGMIPMECVSLLVKHVDFGRHDIIIRKGKGFKDRVTMLALAAPLKEKIALAHAPDVFSYADVQKIYVTI